MNSHWETAPLGRVLRHRKEFITIDDLQTYKRCRVQSYGKGVVLRDLVAGAEVKTKQQQVCRAGEFLVAEIDAKVGGFGVVPTELDGAIVSSHYFLFTIDDALLDRRFLDYFVRTPDFQGQVSAQGTTNYAAIRPQHVLEYTIPLPPLDEQRRIVAHIDALAARISEARGLRQAALEEAEKLAIAARRECFDHLMTLPQAVVVKFESVCDTIVDNLHSNPIYDENGLYPCIRSSDVGWGQLFLETARRTNEEEYSRRTQRGVPQPNDIVLVREGGGTGKAAVVNEGQVFSLGQRVMMLRPNQHLVLPRFMLHQMLSPFILEDQVLQQMKGSASPHLNISSLRRFQFILVPIGMQQQVVSHLDSLGAETNSLRDLQTESAAELDALLPSVLDQAIRGELS